MAGRVNMRKHARIRKCRPEDKKDGRKHPVEDQNWCLWDSKGKEILYAGPTRKAVEKQERAVQYYKHNASVIMAGSVFRRALVQAPEPGPPPLSPSRRTAYSTDDQYKKELRAWLHSFVVYAQELDEVQEDLLEWFVDQPAALKQIYSRYPSMVSAWNKNKMDSVAGAYGDIGMNLVEASNNLQTIFRQRGTYTGYLKKIVPVIDKLPDDDPTKALFLDAAETLHFDEAVV